MKGSDPAFPEQIVKDGDGVYQSAGQYIDVGGLTKREYFAIRFASALIASPNNVLKAPKNISDCAVQMADSLINALNGKTS